MVAIEPHKGVLSQNWSSEGKAIIARGTCIVGLFSICMALATAPIAVAETELVETTLTASDVTRESLLGFNVIVLQDDTAFDAWGNGPYIEARLTRTGTGLPVIGLLVTFSSGGELI